MIPRGGGKNFCHLTAGCSQHLGQDQAGRSARRGLRSGCRAVCGSRRGAPRSLSLSFSFGRRWPTPGSAHHPPQSLLVRCDGGSSGGRPARRAFVLGQGRLPSEINRQRRRARPQLRNATGDWALINPGSPKLAPCCGIHLPTPRVCWPIASASTLHCIWSKRSGNTLHRSMNSLPRSPVLQITAASRAVQSLLASATTAVFLCAPCRKPSHRFCSA
jgi:hypothetical protein